jgi:hypothetical protein
MRVLVFVEAVFFATPSSRTSVPSDAQQLWIRCTQRHSRGRARDHERDEEDVIPRDEPVSVVIDAAENCGRIPSHVEGEKRDERRDMRSSADPQSNSCEFAGAKSDTTAPNNEAAGARPAAPGV